MATVRTSVEGVRGCGFRKGGGLYLVASGLGDICDRLPLPCVVCPTCKHGIKPARGFAWIDADEMFGHEVHGSAMHNARCPLGPLDHGFKDKAALADHCLIEHSAAGWPANPIEEFAVTRNQHEGLHRLRESGLLWIGEKFYATPEHFAEEAARMGVSRRISAIPKGFKVGETWVFLGHRRAIREWTAPEGSAAERVPVYSPGIFRVFRPTAIEYVVTGEETDEQLDALEKRGLALVKVIPAEGVSQTEMFEEEDEDA